MGQFSIYLSVWHLGAWLAEGNYILENNVAYVQTPWKNILQRVGFFKRLSGVGRQLVTRDNPDNRKGDPSQPCHSGICVTLECYLRTWDPGQKIKVAITLSGKTVLPEKLTSFDTILSLNGAADRSHSVHSSLTQVSPHSWLHQEKTIHRRGCVFAPWCLALRSPINPGYFGNILPHYFLTTPT